MIRTHSARTLCAGFLILTLGPTALDAKEARTQAAPITTAKPAGAQLGPTTWYLADEPQLQLGHAGVNADEGGDIFARLIGALRLPSGRLVLGDAGAHTLRYYDLDGQPLRSVGQRGAGPAEFQGLTWIAECAADSVFAYDYVNRRVSVFDSNGELRRSFTPTSPGSASPPAALSCNRDGTIVVVGRGAPESSVSPYFRPRVPMGIATRTGELVAMLGFVPGSERYRRRMSVGPRPLGKMTAIGVGSGQIFLGLADSYEIDVYDLEGQRVRTFGRDVPPRPITDADLATYRELELAKAQPSQVPSWTRQLAEMEYPKQFPAYGAFLVDGEGNLWIESYELHPDAPRSWSVFDVAGTYLGDVTVPARFELYQVGSDWVIGKWRDDVDVEHLRLYRLHK